MILKIDLTKDELESLLRGQTVTIYFDKQIVKIEASSLRHSLSGLAGTLGKIYQGL